MYVYIYKYKIICMHICVYISICIYIYRYIEIYREVLRRKMQNVRTELNSVCSDYLNLVSSAPGY